MNELVSVPTGSSTNAFLGMSTEVEEFYVYKLIEQSVDQLVNIGAKIQQKVAVRRFVAYV